MFGCLKFCAMLWRSCPVGHSKGAGAVANPRPGDSSRGVVIQMFHHHHSQPSTRQTATYHQEHGAFEHVYRVLFPFS